jgi:CubicO group peptidase (beta-lactamase class C family)
MDHNAVALCRYHARIFYKAVPRPNEPKATGDVIAAIQTRRYATMSDGDSTMRTSDTGDLEARLSDAGIRSILEERVPGQDDGAGLVVGVLMPHHRSVVVLGHGSEQDRRPLDADTLFEIGSITKVFTALLLADMVERGEVALADPVAKYLPAGVKLPEPSDRQITLLDLATHTSGLPFMADEQTVSTDPAGEKYSIAQLYEFLGRIESPRQVGTEWEYSNIGYWLLAEALSSRAGMSYEDLLLTRVIALLELKSTAFALSPDMKARLAAGYDASMQPAPAITAVPAYAAMPAAGSLVSTANDLMAFLSVAMGLRPSPLAPAMAAMLRSRRPTGEPGVEQALGWLVMSHDDGTLVFHDGGTLGYAGSIAWDPGKQAGVVVLMNQVGDVGDIARHLLRPEVPLAKPVTARHVEIALDPSLLAGYSGEYEAEGEGVFAVLLERDYLTVEFPPDWGLPRLRLRPESQTDFFTAELPLRVTFETGGGQATGLVVYPPRGQGGVHADRLPGPH